MWTSAAAAAVVPLPAEYVERVYSRGVYPAVQPYVTAASNAVPWAVLDIALGVVLVVLITRYASGYRADGWRPATLRLLVSLVTATAAIYLLFLLTWGLNYRRVPLEARLDFDRARISHEAAARLAAEATARLNDGHGRAHGATFRREALERSFADAQGILGDRGGVRTGRPKRSLFGVYFRQAAIDGMTVPVFLEIIVNPDLLPVEQPSVLAHEWAHLAGYADESEANFVAWLTGVRSKDPLAQYSAWLDAYRLSVSALPRPLRATLPPLDDGPRADLRAIAARYARSSPAVRTAARGVYDSYLKANRIEEGIDNYGMVLQLMLGTRYEEEETWKPILRPAG